LLEITIGPSVAREFSGGKTAVAVPEKGWIGLADLIGPLGVSLHDAEGSILVFLNDRLVAADMLPELRLHDGDHLCFYRMLAGG
jgi:hypothetical protein